jgi:hypothetical protein
MTDNIIPITPDRADSVAENLMQDIRKLLVKETTPVGGVVSIGIIEADPDHAKMCFLLDDGLVYTVRVGLAGGALDSAEASNADLS